MKTIVKVERHGYIWKGIDGATYLWDNTIFQNVLTGELYDVIVERISEDCLLISN